MADFFRIFRRGRKKSAAKITITHTEDYDTPDSATPKSSDSPFSNAPPPPPSSPFSKKKVGVRFDDTTMNDDDDDRFIRPDSFRGKKEGVSRNSFEDSAKKPPPSSHSNNSHNSGRRRIIPSSSVSHHPFQDFQRYRNEMGREKQREFGESMSGFERQRTLIDRPMDIAMPPTIDSKDVPEEGFPEPLNRRRRSIIDNVFRMGVPSRGVPQEIFRYEVDHSEENGRRVVLAEGTPKISTTEDGGDPLDRPNVGKTAEVVRDTKHKRPIASRMPDCPWPLWKSPNNAGDAMEAARALSPVDRSDPTDRIRLTASEMAAERWDTRANVDFDPDNMNEVVGNYVAGRLIDADVDAGDRESESSTIRSRSFDTKTARPVMRPPSLDWLIPRRMDALTGHLVRSNEGVWRQPHPPIAAVRVERPHAVDAFGPPTIEVHRGLPKRVDYTRARRASAKLSARDVREAEEHKYDDNDEFATADGKTYFKSFPNAKAREMWDRSMGAKEYRARVLGRYECTEDEKEEEEEAATRSVALVTIPKRDCVIVPPHRRGIGNNDVRSVARDCWRLGVELALERTVRRGKNTLDDGDSDLSRMTRQGHRLPMQQHEDTPPGLVRKSKKAKRTMAELREFPVVASESSRQRVSGGGRRRRRVVRTDTEARTGSARLVPPPPPPPSLSSHPGSSTVGSAARAVAEPPPGLGRPATRRTSWRRVSPQTSLRKKRSPLLHHRAQMGDTTKSPAIASTPSIVEAEDRKRRQLVDDAAYLASTAQIDKIRKLLVHASLTDRERELEEERAILTTYAQRHGGGKRKVIADARVPTSRLSPLELRWRSHLAEGGNRSPERGREFAGSHGRTKASDSKRRDRNLSDFYYFGSPPSERLKDLAERRDDRRSAQPTTTTPHRKAEASVARECFRLGASLIGKDAVRTKHSSDMSMITMPPPPPPAAPLRSVNGPLLSSSPVRAHMADLAVEESILRNAEHFELTHRGGRTGDSVPMSEVCQCASCWAIRRARGRGRHGMILGQGGGVRFSESTPPGLE